MKASPWLEITLLLVAIMNATLSHLNRDVSVRLMGAAAAHAPTLTQNTSAFLKHIFSYGPTLLRLQSTTRLWRYGPFSSRTNSTCRSWRPSRRPRRSSTTREYCWQADRCFEVAMAGVLSQLEYFPRGLHSCFHIIRLLLSSTVMY